MKLIGKGAFTKCFLLDCGSKVRLESSDPIKEVMAEGWFPESDLFPKVVSVDHGVYEMEYFPKPINNPRSLKKNLDPDQYEIYKTLRGVMDDITHTLNIHNQYTEVYKAFERIECETLRDVMIEALDACANINSCIAFEISPRNIAIKNGKLILLDCFFDKKTLKDFRTGKIKPYGK